MKSTFVYYTIEFNDRLRFVINH